MNKTLYHSPIHLRMLLVYGEVYGAILSTTILSDDFFLFFFIPCLFLVFLCRFCVLFSSFRVYYIPSHRRRSGSGGPAFAGPIISLSTPFQLQLIRLGDDMCLYGGHCCRSF